MWATLNEACGWNCFSLGFRVELKELDAYVKEERYDELRALFRSDPLINIRKACFYLANYTPEAGEKRQKAIAAYKAMISAVEKLDNQALLVSRKKSTADVSALLADLTTKLDTLIELIPNPLK